MESVQISHKSILSIHSIYLHTGPEVVSQAVKVLEVVAASITDVDLQLETHDFGGCAIDKFGEPLPESTLKACQGADAILMGTLAFIQLSKFIF